MKKGKGLCHVSPRVEARGAESMWDDFIARLDSLDGLINGYLACQRRRQRTRQSRIAWEEGPACQSITADHTSHRTANPLLVRTRRR